MRPEITRELGYVSAATTTNIGANTSVVSTQLSALYPNDDYFNGWFIRIGLDSDGSTSSNNTVVRRITDYAGSTGTLTVAGANLTAEDEAVDFELFRFNPTTVRLHLNRARQNLFPHIAIIRDYRTLVTGQRQTTYTLPSTLRHGALQVYTKRRQSANSYAENLFTDPGFENWTNATTPADWTNTSHTSVNQEQQTTSPKNFMVLDGANSARLVAAASTLGTLLQTVTPSVATQSVECNVSIWVYCLTGSRVSVRIGSSDGTAHTGTGWEQIVQTANLGETATNFSAGLVVSAGAAISYYGDEAIATLGPSEVLDEGWEQVMNWRWIPPSAGASNGGLLEHIHLPELTMLRVLSRDLLSSVTNDTDTLEIDADELLPLYDETRRLLCLETANTSTAKEREYWKDRAEEYRLSVAGKLGNQPQPKHYFRIPDWGR